MNSQNPRGSSGALVGEELEKKKKKRKSGSGQGALQSKESSDVHQIDDGPVERGEGTSGRKLESQYACKKVTVSHVLEPKGGQAAPYVCYFPSGFTPRKNVPRGGDAEAGHTNDVQFTGYQASTRAKKKKHILVAETEKVQYTGKSHDAEMQGWHPGQLALGIYDKTSGTLQLMPVAADKLLRMDARVKAVDYNDKAAEQHIEEEEEDDEALRKRRLQQRKNLTEAFGSKKRKADALALERGAIDGDRVEAAQAVQDLFQAAANQRGTVTREDLEQRMSEAVERNIPPHDLSATTPEGAYPIDSLVSREEAAALRVESVLGAAADPVKVANIKKGRFYKTSIKNRIHQLALPGDKVGNESRASALLYLNCLLKFYSFPPDLVFRQTVKKPAEGDLASAEPGSKQDSVEVKIISDFESISALTSIPLIVLERFVSLFAERAQGEGGYRRPKHCEQLLLGYILILCLTVDCYSSDPSDLAKDLKRPIAQLVPYYRALGCKVDRKAVKGSETIYRATLPVPLTLPKVRLAPKK
eukprot:jgi/Mesen1/730/ME000011S00062